jgi:hypothetical protein
VYIWFTSILPVLQAVEAMSFVKYTKQLLTECAPTSEGVPQICEDSPTQLVLGVSTAVFLFCLHGLRVLWPKCFEGELPQHDRSNRWSVMIAFGRQSAL